MHQHVGKLRKLLWGVITVTILLNPLGATAATPPSAATPQVAVVSEGALQQARQLVPEDGPLRVRWALGLKNRTIHRFYLPPAELDYAYFLVETKEHNLLAIDRRSGKTLWWTNLEAEIFDKPAFSQYATYLICKDFLIALERFSGEVIWRLHVKTAPRFGPGVYETIKGKPQIYIPSIDSIVYCYAPQKYIWPPEKGTNSITRKDIILERFSLNRVWQTKSFGLFTGPLAQKERFIFIADDRGTVAGISTANVSSALAKDTWTFKARKAISGGVLPVGPSVYVASRDSYLYCLSRREGGVMWKYQTGEILKRAPEVILDPFQNKTCLLLWAKGDLLALDDTNGKLLWTKKAIDTVVARMTDPEEEMSKRTSIVMLGQDNKLHANYLSSGEENWSLSASHMEVVCPNTQMEFILVAFDKRQSICALEQNR